MAIETTTTYQMDSKTPTIHEVSAADQDTPAYVVCEVDPDKTIGVPMLQTRDKASTLNQIFGKHKFVQEVHIRQMKRSHYQKHYAKDKDGNYIGTEKPADDAALIFVPNHSTPEDIKEQVRKCAFGKEHFIGDMGGAGGTTLLGIEGVGLFGLVSSKNARFPQK